MSQLDRTHDSSPQFDVSLQAVLGLAWLLSQVEALPDGKPAGSPAASSVPSSSSCHDPASLAVLGIIAVAGELTPVLEALRTGASQGSLVGADGRGEIERLQPAGRDGARRSRGALDGLLR